MAEDQDQEQEAIDPAVIELIQQGKAANRQEAEAMLKRLEEVAEDEGGDPEDDDIGDDEDEAMEDDDDEDEEEEVQIAGRPLSYYDDYETKEDLLGLDGVGEAKAAEILSARKKRDRK